MSTKTVTNNNATFNPTGMAAYNGLQPSLLSGLNQNINNPWLAMGGNQQLAAGNQQVYGQSQSAFQNLAQSMTQRGITSNSPLFASMLNRLRGATSSAQNNMYSNLLLTAQNLQTGSATAATQYQPLQTGTTQVQSKGGIGSFV